MPAHRLKAYIYLLVATAIWGAAGSVIKYTLEGFPPVIFLTYRFFLSGLLALGYFLIVGFKFPKPKTTIPLSLLFGFLAYTVALGLLFIGLEKTTVLDLTVMALLEPLLAVVGGVFFFKEHITLREKIGISIVIAGSSFIAFSPMFLDHSEIKFSGNIFIMLFIVADAVSSLIAKKLTWMEVDSGRLVNLGFIVGALTITPLSLLTYGFEQTIQTIVQAPLGYHLGVWYMAFLSGTLAYALYVLGQKSIEVSEAALFRYLQPIFSVPLAIFWLGEIITLPFVIGAIITTTGITIAEVKKRRKVERKRSS